MMEAQLRSLLADVKEVDGPTRRAASLDRLADMLDADTTHYRQEHLAVFDEVLGELTRGIEAKTLAVLSSRLARLDRPPPDTLRSLALNEAIEVAEPVLAESPAVDDATLVECAERGSQRHLMAICRRARIAEPVTDVIVERGEMPALTMVVGNPGARFSASGFDTLASRSQTDDGLLELLGMRTDVPRNIFLRLLVLASDEARERLKARHPRATANITQAVRTISNDVIERSSLKRADYMAAEDEIDALVARSLLNERAVRRMAEDGRFLCAVTGLARLARIPVAEVEKMLSQERNDSLMVLLRAQEFSWKTARAILRLRTGGGELSAVGAERAAASFERINPQTAQKVLEFQRRRAGLLR